MRTNRAPTVRAHHVDGLQGFGECADLVQFHQKRVGGFFFDTAGNAFGVGHQQVITHNLQAMANRGGECFPAFPVILSKAIFN